MRRTEKTGLALLCALPHFEGAQRERERDPNGRARAAADRPRETQRPKDKRQREAWMQEEDPGGKVVEPAQLGP
jgi:hypothetical protein